MPSPHSEVFHGAVSGRNQSVAQAPEPVAPPTGVARTSYVSRFAERVLTSNTVFRINVASSHPLVRATPGRRV